MPLTFIEAFTAIGAADFPAAVDFYQALLGGEPDERVRDVYAAFRLPGMVLGIFAPSPDDRSEFANSAEFRGGLSLVLRVPDAEAARRQLLSLAPSRPPSPVRSTGHGREFYAYDPDGNRLIVVEPT